MNKKVEIQGKLNVQKLVTITLFLLICVISNISIHAQSFSQIKTLAESGDAETQFGLGLNYYSGKFCDKDYEKAVFWLKKSKDNGYKKAIPYLAWVYYEKNMFSAAYPLFFSFAQNPDNKEVDEYMYVRSLYFVGACKLQGKGIVKDEKAAIYWLEKAKSYEMPDAYALLGVCHLHGLGVKKDSKEAYSLFKEALDKDAENELYALDVLKCYALGCGNAYDAKKAYPLVEQYAESKEDKAIAQLILGVAYYKDDTVDEHYNKAFKWLTKVIQNDDATEKEKGSAIYWLQRCYRFGRGVPKDINKANELVKQYSGYESDEPRLIELLEPYY